MGTRLGRAVGLAFAICLSVWLQAASDDSRVADAAMGGDAATVKTLLKQGADVNAAQGDGMTALHWAARQGDVELGQMLVYAGANVRAVTRIGGFTPLLMASERGYAGVIDVLLKAGADPKTATSSGTTPLMFAAASGQTDAVKLLLDKGVDVNAAESARGETPLMFATASNRVRSDEGTDCQRCECDGGDEGRGPESSDEP